MLIAWDNMADAATVSAGSQVASLPGSNVQDPQISRKWCTAAGVVSSYLLFDMGSAIAASVLAALGTNLTPSATVRVRASTSDATAASGDLLDTTTLAAGVKTGYGAIYKKWNAVTARYWRVDLADAALTDHIEVGRVAILPSWQPESNQIYDWSVTPTDESRRTKAYGGQSQIEVLAKFRLLQFELNYLTQSEAWAQAFALQRSNGVTTDVLAIPDITSAYLSEQAVWGLLTASQPVSQRNSRYFRQKFSIEERV
jgi:hypothetical protein